MTPEETPDPAPRRRPLSAEEVRAHLEVDSAIAEAAASPLDQDRVEEMRRILAGPSLRSARAVLSKLAPPRSTRHLSVVESDGMSPGGTR